MRQANIMTSRRGFLKRSGIAIVTGLAVHPLEVIAQGAEKTGKPEEEISPVEDLMREHGVLSRALPSPKSYTLSPMTKKSFVPLFL